MGSKADRRAIQKNAETWVSSAPDSETAVDTGDGAPASPRKAWIVETSGGDEASAPPPKDWTGGATEKQAAEPTPVKAEEREYISGIKFSARISCR